MRLTSSKLRIGHDKVGGLLLTELCFPFLKDMPKSTTLEDRSFKVRKEAYVPYLCLLSHDIFDDLKESHLCGHNAKLVIVCALNKTLEGVAIHVVENLQVCKEFLWGLLEMVVVVVFISIYRNIDASIIVDKDLD